MKCSYSIQQLNWKGLYVHNMCFRSLVICTHSWLMVFVSQKLLRFNWGGFQIIHLTTLRVRVLHYQNFFALFACSYCNILIKVDHYAICIIGRSIYHLFEQQTQFKWQFKTLFIRNTKNISGQLLQESLEDFKINFNPLTCRSL